MHCTTALRQRILDCHTIAWQEKLKDMRSSEVLQRSALSAVFQVDGA